MNNRCCFLTCRRIRHSNGPRRVIQILWRSPSSQMYLRRSHKAGARAMIYVHPGTPVKCSLQHIHLHSRKVPRVVIRAKSHQRVRMGVRRAPLAKERIADPLPGNMHAKVEVRKSIFGRQILDPQARGSRPRRMITKQCTSCPGNCSWLIVILAPDSVNHHRFENLQRGYKPHQ